MPLSRNMGTLTSWNPLGHFRPVTGLLYLYHFVGNISLVRFRWYHFVGTISLVPFLRYHFDGNTSLLPQEILRQVHLSDSSLLGNYAGSVEDGDSGALRNVGTYQLTRRHVQGDLNIHRYDYQSFKSHIFSLFWSRGEF